MVTGRGTLVGKDNSTVYNHRCSQAGCQTNIYIYLNCKLFIDNQLFFFTMVVVKYLTHRASLQIPQRLLLNSETIPLPATHTHIRVPYSALRKSLP